MIVSTKALTRIFRCFCSFQCTHRRFLQYVVSLVQWIVSYGLLCCWRCDESDSWYDNAGFLFVFLANEYGQRSVIRNWLWSLFLKSPETFRAYFGYYNALFISSQRRGSNSLGFSYLKNMLKDHLFKTSRLQFDNCGFWGPKSYRDFRETDPCPLKRCYDENNRLFFSDFFY